MTIESWLQDWGRGWRGPTLAAFVALIAGLPGMLTLPPLDRDESRFAEASAQMLESGDFVTIHFQDQPRFKKPIGIYWLQAASVAALSDVEDRDIWAYRVPSLLGAMLAAAACVWGAAAFLPPGLALLSGVMLGSSFLLSTEAAIAATDGVLAGAVTLMMAALGRIYLAARDGPAAGAATRALFWIGLALSILVKGPIGPMVAVLAVIALSVWDRRFAWLKGLGWGWGLIFLAAVLLPWAVAITVATDGAFWGAAVGGDLAPKLVEGQEGHGAPPGYYLLLLPLLIFPAALLLPAAAVQAWRDRAEPAVRFALCWLIPSWLVFEITPTKLVHYTLPLYCAVAWLAARALTQPLGPRVRLAGRILVLVAALAAAVLGFALAAQEPLAATLVLAGVAAALLIGAGVVAAWLAARRPVGAIVVAAGLAVLGHDVLLGTILPRISPLWLSSRAADILEVAGDTPRGGVVEGPIAVAGYAEPSLVFLLGADTELGDARTAARAIEEHRPAIVEGRDQAAFAEELAALGVQARQIGQVSGLDYSKGRRDILRLYLPAAPAAPEAS
ncbi:MAG TPA: glycosyltransferase family 39 protein [Caulobacteraceae bacterium]|nr:glycosyltransferase family 39 protein [Caulobacteraceae bacterium]